MREVLALSTFMALAATLLGSLNLLTAPRIAEARSQARFAAVAQLAGSPGPFESRAVGAAGVQVLTDATRPAQHIVLASSNGYGGRIEVGVVLDAAGMIVALDTLHHQETPGLGDFIETRRSTWNRQFVGRSGPAGDLNDIDGRTGATITARAFTRAVDLALEDSRS